MKTAVPKHYLLKRLIVLLLTFAPGLGLKAAVPTRQELNRARAWAKANFSTSRPAANLPPFSFTYGTKPSIELLKGWKLRVGPQTRRGAEWQQSYSYTDPATGLELTAELTRYDDFPAVEWVLYFKNSGHEPTPILQDIRALDVRFRSDEGTFILHRALGCASEPTDFAPVDQTLEPGAQISLAPVGGRSSGTTALPFFNLEAPTAQGRRGREPKPMTGVETLSGGGVIIGVGWSGQWSANFSREANSIHIQAGMELTHLKLMPGERIRSPRVLLLFWQDPDRLRGHNLLRSFILAHHTPRPGGHEIALPVAAMSFFQFNWGEEVNERNQIEFASRYQKRNIAIDHFWLDSGWYEGGFSHGRGNWFPKRDAFPQGLRPLADALHGMGMRFIVWFEPELVLPGTWLASHHSEWLLGKDKKLLNLGNGEARLWLTDHISRMIEQDRIDVYRHDFNMNPLEYWRGADAPDRQGMTEIRYIEGLYEYWDELLRRHPNLLIDNCASGGRRIDLETVSRSVVLWRTDHAVGTVAAQAHGVGLGLYVPFSATAAAPCFLPRAEIPDVYMARSVMGPGLVLAWEVRRSDFDDALARRIVAEHRRIRKFYTGDLYPLTSVTVSEGAWLAYQCDRADLGEGIVMAFRHEKATEESLTVKLRSLKADRTYELEDVDRGSKRTVTGKELAGGLRVSIPTVPGSALLIYKEGSVPAAERRR